ncbi:MAG: 5-formyltetrahydrofolate cyclo-ligase, partial [Verrucomicrobia bacterium]|nr:5-formyltetrahydrofolate cyclo-ligase [Verrucomicrobiota bacterium]
VVGLFYSVQELAEIPQEPHDIPLPGVVTENGWRKLA